MHIISTSDTHTHTRLMALCPGLGERDDLRGPRGPLSRTTRVSRYQKGKTNMDFTEARDSEWQWHQLGHMQVCMPAPHHSYFYRPEAFPAAQPTASKHIRHIKEIHTNKSRTANVIDN